MKALTILIAAMLVCGVANAAGLFETYDGTTYKIEEQISNTVVYDGFMWQTGAALIESDQLQVGADAGGGIQRSLTRYDLSLAPIGSTLTPTSDGLLEYWLLNGPVGLPDPVAGTTLDLIRMDSEVMWSIATSDYDLADIGSFTPWVDGSGIGIAAGVPTSGTLIDSYVFNGGDYSLGPGQRVTFDIPQADIVAMIAGTHPGYAIVNRDEVNHNTAFAVLIGSHTGGPWVPTFSFQAIPEPSIMLVGLLAFLRRRK